jgi:hypothetical protein
MLSNDRSHAIKYRRSDESTNTDKNILDESYYLAKHFPDFPLLEYRIASFLKLNC